MESIQKHLSAVNLLHRFQKLCSGHNIPNGKPAPDIYLRGAASLGLPPESCIALEDAPTGIESAYRLLRRQAPELDEADRALFLKRFISLFPQKDAPSPERSFFPQEEKQISTLNAQKILPINRQDFFLIWL